MLAQIPASVDGTDLSGVFDDPTRTDLKEAAFVEAAVCKLKGNGTLWGNDYCPEEGWEGFMGCAPLPPCSDLPPSPSPAPSASMLLLTDTCLCQPRHTPSNSSAQTASPRSNSS